MKNSKNKKKNNKTTLVVVLLLIIVLLVGGMCLFVSSNIKPVGGSNLENKMVTIEDNWYGKKVLQYLDEEGVIRNGDIAYLYAKIKNIPLNFKAGTYDVNTSLSFEDLVAYLSDGTNAIQDTVSVKFIEGWRAKDFANAISEAINLNYDDIMASWNDEAYVRSLMADYPFLTEEMFDTDVKCLLEGYLFPDTYEFFKNTTIDNVTKRLLDSTLAVYNEYKDGFDSSRYSIHELFTLASIVQRETGNTSDMAKVASVFYNRLDEGMQLQSSVTVCYALDIGLGEDWTKCEIIQDSSDPYNTYQVQGFPPGAICNPGKDAIKAVLYPEETDYFFFIGDVCGDGGTIFAKTYGEQLENQKEYLSCY